MATVQQYIDKMTAWDGYRDNRGAKVWKNYAPVDYEPASYCGAGQAMISKQLGVPYGPTTHAREIYVPYVVQDARKAGKWLYSVDAKPGDKAIFCWSGGYHNQPASAADHIEMVLNNNPALPYFDTFGFNTAASDGSLPRGAFVRRRLRSQCMGCVDMQDTFTKKGATPVEPHRGIRLAVDGVLGPLTIYRWEQVMGTPLDPFGQGRFDLPYSKLTAALQKWFNAHGFRDARGHKLKVDGQGIQPNIGRTWPVRGYTRTIQAMQAWTGTPVDGRLSVHSPCVKVVQRKLNAHK